MIKTTFEKYHLLLYYKKPLRTRGFLKKEGRAVGFTYSEHPIETPYYYRVIPSKLAIPRGLEPLILP